MKKFFITTLLVFAGISTAIFAQSKTNSMIQERIAYMKSNLTLSGTENNNFWTAYEQYLNEELKIMEAYRKNLAKQGIKLGAPGTNKEVIANLSDKQVTYMQDQKFELRKNLLNLETAYHKKFKAILSPHHLQNYYDLEYKYKKELAKKKAAKKPVEPVNGGKKRR